MEEPPTETQSLFESFRQLEAERPDVERLVLLRALGTALEKRGHGRLVSAVARPASGDLTGLLVPVLFWGLGASLGTALDRPWPIWLALSVAILIGYGILASQAPRLAGPAAGALVLAWIASAVAVALTAPAQLVFTHGIPIAGATLVGLALRSLRVREARDVIAGLAGVGRSAPFLAPVVLVAILLPALTADVWELAAATDSTNLIGAGLASIGVLLLLVARQLRRELEPAFVARCRSLTARATVPEDTRAALMASVDPDTARVIGELPSENLNEAWPRGGEEYAPYLVAAEGGSLRRPLAARLLITTAAIALLLTGYIYVLLAVIVPRPVATTWANAEIGVREILGTGILAPGDAYIAMAVLLGIFATAIFLAFTVTEERVATALTEALLREPIDRFLLLALPFVSLVEWALQQGHLHVPDVPEAAPESSADGSGSGDVRR